MSRMRLLITILIATHILIGAGFFAMEEFVYRSDIEGVFTGLYGGWTIGQTALLGAWLAIGQGLMIWRLARVTLLVLWIEIVAVIADGIDPTVSHVITIWLPIFLVAGWFLLVFGLKRQVQGVRVAFRGEFERSNWQFSLFSAITWLSEVASILGAMHLIGLLGPDSNREFFRFAPWFENLVSGVVLPLVFAPVIWCALAPRRRKFWFSICAVALYALAAVTGAYEYARPIPDYLVDTYRYEQSYALRTFGPPVSAATSILVSVFGSVWLARRFGYDCISTRIVI